MARGCALALSRRYAEAAREFDDAIARNPQLFDSYYYFARTAFAAGDIARSADLFRQASEVRLEDCQSPILMGQSLEMVMLGWWWWRAVVPGHSDSSCWTDRTE